MQYRQSIRNALLPCLGALTCLLAIPLTGCPSDNSANASDGGTADGGNFCGSGQANPGSSCINPVRFDFDAGSVDIVGDLKKKNIDFEKPSDGFQIATQGIRLGAQDDDEWCEAFAVPENPAHPGQDWCVTRAEVAMTKGFHHLFVAKAPIGSTSESLMEVGKRVRCVGGAHVTYGSDLLPIPLPQGEYVNVPYYKGVGEHFKPGQKISVNYHYLNTTDKDLIAETMLNFHAAPCEGLVDLNQFGFYNQDISIPPHGQYSTAMSATFTQDVYVLDIFRHTHRLGGEVPISFYKGPNDGKVFFNSPDYETGASFQFPKPVLIHKGEGFTFVCNYDNPRDNWVKFGPTANDEMCMLLGTFWVAHPDEVPSEQHRYKWSSN